MLDIKIKDVVILSVIVSFLLFVTGLVTVPYANRYDTLTQNFIYFVGRIPVVFAAILMYFNIGKRYERSSQ